MNYQITPSEAKRHRRARMTTTILTDEQVGYLFLDWYCFFKDNHGSASLCIRAIEQAVLQSPKVQEWKEDAERYRKLSAMATQQADSLGPIFRIDVRRSAPYLFNFDAAIDAAMEKQL